MKLYRFLRNVSSFRTINSGDIKATANVERLQSHHIPVMAKEILESFWPIKDDQCFLDMTFGGGGHTRRLLATNKKITIFALDRDPAAFERAVALSKQLKHSSNHQQRLVPLLGRFSQLTQLLEKLNVPQNVFDGVIVDLGASQYQYDQAERGFSLRLDGPLDMRMDCCAGLDTNGPNRNLPTAADVVNSLNAEELANIFKVYGEEKNAIKIAQAIVDSRFMMKRLNTTRELAELVQSVTAGKHGQQMDKLGRQSHPATRVFQALRIFVNNELNELNYAINAVRKYLKVRQPNESNEIEDDGELITEQRNDGGLLAIISFHSLEDKIVKSHFAEQQGKEWVPPNSDDYSLCPNNHQQQQQWNIQNRKSKHWKFYRQKLFVPNEDEVFHNPRSRSAKLRVGLRIN